ncbi:MAG TPA: cytochrome c oxidase accessory protein CcoG, partial [Rhodospirillales bacterium]|nr:cytochrome c oxidase accessory protein CcoG [Rhodospirillales bacterium]
RGKAKIGQSFDGRGHCVNCNNCVLVCPTGVDIRKGQQVACIGCALCIDACDSIMDKFNLPRGLIAYDSEDNQVARAKGRPTKTRLWRPRTFAYGAILLLIAALISYKLAFRGNLEINVQADRAPYFVTLTDGRIRSGYTFKVVNKQRKPRTFVLSLRGVEGAVMRVIGHGGDDAASVELDVGADKVGAFRVFIKADPKKLSGKSALIVFALKDKESGETFRHNAMLHGPGRKTP